MKARKTLNKPLLRKLALKLRRLRHEKHYDQSNWGRDTECGTAACVAGWTVLMSGYRLANRYGKCTKDGHTYSTSRVARWLLGLGPKAARRLFDAGGEMWPETWKNRMHTAALRSEMCEPAERPSRIAADLLDSIAGGKVKP